MKCQLIPSTGAALIAVLGISAGAQAITIRHDVSDGYYQNLGNSYASVGFMTIDRVNNFFMTSTETCSGTLIGSHWVLTAAHCTENLSSASFEIGQSHYSILEYAIHPDWLRLGGRSSIYAFQAGVDIALARLDRAVPDVIPSPLYPFYNEVGKILLSTPIPLR